MTKNFCDKCGELVTPGVGGSRCALHADGFSWIVESRVFLPSNKGEAILCSYCANSILDFANSIRIKSKDYADTQS